MRAISRPYRDCLLFFCLTRLFLPGYFHSPLPGLDPFSRQGIAILQKPTAALKVFSVTGNVFMRWVYSKTTERRTKG